ncbi:MAG: RluA family pseudouridine synthase [Oscillospiraceae bacterium]
MKILYEDKFLMVVEKPADVLSEPSEKGVDVLTLASGQAGAPCFLVHRLDRNTGGAMVLAKSASTAGRLSEQIQKREFVKEYLAVVKGVPEAPEGVFEDLLFKDSAKNKTFVVKRERKGVKKASLSYRVLSTAQNGEHGEVSLVLVRLNTGRTHQVRVQFASRKMPLLGDGKYGSRDNRCETALWSFRLAFEHPATREKIDVSCLPPKEYPWDLFDLRKPVKG